ncbi:MAG: DUF1295 domain-containing protein, partial [Proteobacteria bacterium]
ARDGEVAVNALEIVGVCLFIAGLLGETVADRQLKNFVRERDNRGLVCEVGLWNYSRHPNYFFESVIWLGLGTFALGSPGGAWALISTGILITLITQVTGVPYAEKQSIKSKGDLYRAYQATTSAFVPWFKKLT